MIVTVTQLRLKSFWKFFSLANRARKIVTQAKKAPGNTGYKSRGFWLDHYTMSRWESMEAMRAFAKSGAHLDAMKNTGRIAEHTVVYTFEAEEFPSWTEAKAMLKEKGRKSNFS